MVREEMLKLVKSNLKLDTEDYDLLILDWIQEAISFCNLRPEVLPEFLEPFIRKKVKAIIDYETAKGTGYQQDISSIKEGDGSITYATGVSNSRDGIYGLSDADKSVLRRFRRLRGYD